MAERDKNDIRKRLEELRKDNNRKNNSKQVKSTNSKNKGMYMAPFPEYLQKRKDTSSIENTTKNRTVTKEDEEAFSEMLKELNSKRDI